MTTSMGTNTLFSQAVPKAHVWEIHVSCTTSLMVTQPLNVLAAFVARNHTTMGKCHTDTVQILPLA